MQRILNFFSRSTIKADSEHKKRLYCNFSSLRKDDEERKKEKIETRKQRRAAEIVFRGVETKRDLDSGGDVAWRNEMLVWSSVRDCDGRLIVESDSDERVSRTLIKD